MWSTRRSCRNTIEKEIMKNFFLIVMLCLGLSANAQTKILTHNFTTNCEQDIKSTELYLENKTISSWFVGTWPDAYGVLFTITSSHLQWRSGELADFVMQVDESRASFKWRDDKTFCIVTRLQQNQVLYIDISSGVSYVVTKR